MQSTNDNSSSGLSDGKCVFSPETKLRDSCHRQKRYEEHTHAIRFVFAWMLITQVLRNFDSGALPVLLGLISDEFGLDEVKLGILGAVPYLSAMATAFIMNHPLQNYSQKWIIVTSIFFLSIGLTLLLSSSSSTLLYISRTIMGSMQAPLSIYIPVWVDEFTPPNKLTAWMGASQVTMIIGVATGYLITGFTLSYHNGWRFSLLVPCLMLFLMSICLIFTKSEYFDVRYLKSENNHSEFELMDKVSTDSFNISGNKFEEKPNNQHSIHSSCSTELVESPYSISLSTQLVTINNIQGNNPEINRVHIPPISFDTRIQRSTNFPSEQERNQTTENTCIECNDSQHRMIIDKPNEYQSSYTAHFVSISRSVSFTDYTGGMPLCVPLPSSINHTIEDSKDKMKSNQIPNLQGSKLLIFKRILATNKWRRLLGNSIYMLSIFILSVIYYVVTAVQFWTTRYLQQIYSTSDGVIFMSFSATAVVAPTTGIIFSGFIVDFIGGYKSNRGLFLTLIFCMSSALLATIFGILTIVIDNFTVTIIGIWGLLFFGSFLVPPITGISVGVVEPEMRQFATTVAMVTYHILGFALGSLLPGAVLQITGITRAGMSIVYGFSGLGVIANFFACIIAYRKLHRLENNGRIEF
ncbi:major facilitator superfamily transporter [Cryptosporidium felis]|nr:major facilitator superfamily transporter [Cryptosporidium felis]